MTVEDTDDGRVIKVLRDGAVKVYNSARQFFTDYHGPEYAARHETIDRYLRRGRWAPTLTTAPGLQLVGGIDLESSNALLAVSTAQVAQPIAAPVEPRQTGITVLVRTAPVRGIDLEARGHEVAKLLYAGFHNWIHSAGYEFEDVLQEVFRKILVANQGRAPWDPKKSSFGHYVHLVCRSALSNFHRKHRRVRQNEVLGVMGIGPDGTWGRIDVRDSGRQERLWGSSSQERPASDPVADLQRYIMRGPLGGHEDAALAATLVPFVQAGHTLKDIAATLGVDRPSVSRAMKLLRQCAAGWAN